jgi:long-subunit fatty acid transport protein
MLWVRSVSSRPFLSIAIVLAVVSASTGVSAGSFELFGVHPEDMAEGSARTAAADDGSACFYNPGGLALGEGNRLQLSGVVAKSLLDAQGQRQTLSDPVGGTLTLSVDVPLEGFLEDRLRVGLAMYSLPDRLMRLRTQSQSTPFFPYYDNRSQRLVFMPGLAVRLADGLGIGVGLNALAGVQGPVDVREGQSRTLESRVVQEAGTVARWILGVRYDPSERVHLGATFRQSFGVPLTVTTTADVAGVPLSVDVSAAEALFDPAVFVVGGRFEPWDRWSLEMDVAYQWWGAWKGPLLQIDTTVSALSLVSKPPQGMFQDTVSVRGAAAWHIERKPCRETVAHMGAGYETSMIDASVQQGRSNFVDGPKTLLGAGLSVRFVEVVGDALRLGVGLQMHHVASYRQDKVVCTEVPCPEGTVVGPDTANPTEAIDNPGYPTLFGGGVVFAGAVGVGMDF